MTESPTAHRPVFGTGNELDCANVDLRNAIDDQARTVARRQPGEPVDRMRCEP
jgi:hypothetical protein